MTHHSPKVANASATAYEVAYDDGTIYGPFIVEAANAVDQNTAFWDASCQRHALIPIIPAQIARAVEKNRGRPEIDGDYIECLLSEAKRTPLIRSPMSANDPKRTLRGCPVRLASLLLRSQYGPKPEMERIKRTSSIHSLI